MNRRFFSALGAALALTTAARADQPVKPAVVPAEFQWVRSLDAEGYVQQENRHDNGIQHFHFRLRYLDPDINAFVGMQTDFDRFNRELVLGTADNAAQGNFLWDMGANIGVVHKKTTWELDLMGVTAAGKLGPALALVCEHRFTARAMYYDRVQGDLFVGDGIFDFDQGLCWTVKKFWGVTAGYRWLISQHGTDRSGPHIGIRYSFDSPKIPFIFPSLG